MGLINFAELLNTPSQWRPIACSLNANKLRYFAFNNGIKTFKFGKQDLYADNLLAFFQCEYPQHGTLIKCHDKNYPELLSECFEVPIEDTDTLTYHVYFCDFGTPVNKDFMEILYAWDCDLWESLEQDEIEVLWNQLEEIRKQFLDLLDGETPAQINGTALFAIGQ